jgi:hypothetical protein
MCGSLREIALGRNLPNRNRENCCGRVDFNEFITLIIRSLLISRPA